MLNRRQTLQGLGGTALALGISPISAATRISLPFENGERPLVKYPQKRPLIRLTTRPPQLETPFSVFDEGILTPNDAFFVRYHLADIPLEIDPATYRLTIGGKVEKPLSLSLTDLKTQFDPVEIVAVNQCSGNSRGFVAPRVGGGQLGHGAMGNARWKGVGLKDVLDRAGVMAGAREVTFNGLDKPVTPIMPDFVKALSMDHARDRDVMLAYAMNGEDLPFLNGFPLRLIVPGYYGTYWVKHLSEIQVVEQAFDGFWMKSAYRVPDNGCACIEPGTIAPATVPISRFSVRSFITSVVDGAKVKAGSDLLIKGIAFDSGYGITDVLLSTDGGQSWTGTQLDEDLGRFSFRGWRTTLRLPAGGHRLMVRAINRVGETQPLKALWNGPGYMYNAIETINLQAV
jgi:DMSO/TMAO reductase YedYZ molybdopterin-dependent catalytic subunit